MVGSAFNVSIWAEDAIDDFPYLSISFTDPDFISNISEHLLVFVCWIFMGLMFTVSSLSLQMVNFDIFHPGIWWSGKFYSK